MTETLLALDVGQTGTKVRFVGANGTTELVLPGVRTHEPILPQLRESVQRAREELGEACTTISVGVSGLTKVDHDAGSLLELIDDPALKRVLLTHDSVTSYLGALGDRRGVVVAAGTGVVTLGVGRSEVARVDGWGNIMGDAGSGYWIGREALDAVMRAHDGRGPSTSLTAVMKNRWPDVEEAYIALQSSPERVKTVASFAHDVAALADSDAVAYAICVAAAKELALSAESALRRVEDPQFPDEAFHVSVLGGVFGGAVVGQQFVDLVRAQRPSVIIDSALGTGLDGAAALPGLLASHPLLGLVSVATH